MAIAIITALQLLQLMTVEQFMYFYHDLKIKSVIEAHKFYGAAITFNIIIGIMAILLLPGINLVINIFVHDLDPLRINLLKNILFIFNIRITLQSHELCESVIL